MDRGGYQTLDTLGNRNEDGDDNQPPDDHNLMVHLVPECNKSKCLYMFM